MRILLAVLASIAATHAASEECPAIENDLDRLACYDLESGRTAQTVTPETSTNETGAWDVRIQKSEFKDTTDVYLTVESDGDLTCGYTSAPASLIARCRENTTSIIISTQCHLTSGYGSYGNVEYRVDDKPAKTRGFDDSTNNRALGLWRGSRSIPMIKELFGGEKLLVRFTPYSESPVTAEFPIAKIETAIEPLREACSW